jgi:hypothetical protein
MNIFIQIGASNETYLGPFNIYSDVDSFGVPFITGVSLETLIEGQYFLTPDGTSIVRVCSVNPVGCYNICIDIYTIDTTPTTTTSTTTIPSYSSICFYFGTETGGEYIEIDINGNAPEQNGRPTYEINSATTVFYTGSQWVQSNLTLGTFAIPDSEEQPYPPEYSSPDVDCSLESAAPLCAIQHGPCPTTTTTTTV